MCIRENMIEHLCPPLEPIPTHQPNRLIPLGPIKAVLFDIYGTLFISGSGDVGTATATNKAESLTQALTVAGFHGDLDQAGVVGIEQLKIEILNWHALARENGTDYPEVEITQIWKKVLDSLCNTETITSSTADVAQLEHLALAYECRVNPVAPMPHAEKLLQQLVKQGYPLGIVSNAQFYTPLLFSAFFKKSVTECGFSPELCSYSFREQKAKPSIDLFPKVLQKLKETKGITPVETVYVGNDMLNDVWTAQQAGCKTVLFAGDKRSLRLREKDERCLAIQPDAVITSLAQLMEIL